MTIAFHPFKNSSNSHFIINSEKLLSSARRHQEAINQATQGIEENFPTQGIALVQHQMKATSSEVEYRRESKRVKERIINNLSFSRYCHISRREKTIS